MCFLLFLFFCFQNECSFVSLRDVERAMMVFKYFFDKMALFGPKMDAWACGNRRHVDNTEDDMESVSKTIKILTQYYIILFLNRNTMLLQMMLLGL